MTDPRVFQPAPVEGGKKVSSRVEQLEEDVAWWRDRFFSVAGEWKERAERAERANRILREFAELVAGVPEVSNFSLTVQLKRRARQALEEADDE